MALAEFLSLESRRVIGQEQKMTDAEIQQFQTDKQRKLNQARCCVEVGAITWQFTQKMIGDN